MKIDMKIAELRQKSKEELESVLSVKRQRVLELRALASGKKVKNVSEISASRKDIARILTLLREK